LYLDKHNEKGEVCIQNTFFTVRKLQSGTGQECVRRAIDYVGVKEWESNLDMMVQMPLFADGELKGQLQQAVPWIIVCWCLAHRLELSLIRML